MINKFRASIEELPPKFWALVGAAFVDRVGGTMIHPFFALYITQKFSVGMTQAGLLLGAFSISGFVGNILGGALADRYGRKSIVLIGLVFSALSAVSMGLVQQLWVFYVLAVLVGLLSDIAGPAWQAMIADILPEKKRTEGFGMLRVVGNLAWIVGPTIGGLIATRSFLMVFILDSICSLITAFIIYKRIPETKPKEIEVLQKGESILETLHGYTSALRDRLFMVYIGASMLMVVVYLQMYNSLSVYLRDQHGVSPQHYGYLLTSSAVMVVICQFWVSRQVKEHPPMLMLALGAVFYMLGFSMFGVVTAYALFVAAILLITVGEMIIMPVSQNLAVKFSPLEMRARYMAVFSMVWAVPAAVGPAAAGLIMDNANPNLVWYIGGVLCGLSAFSFTVLHRATQRRFAILEAAPQPAD